MCVVAFVHPSVSVVQGMNMNEVCIFCHVPLLPSLHFSNLNNTKQLTALLAPLPSPPSKPPQVFYGILVQHFAMLAGQQPLPTAHLDVLTQVGAWWSELPPSLQLT